MKNSIRKISQYLQNSQNKILHLLMGILGFSAACTPACEYGVPAVEYGTPTAEFILTGNVKSSQTDLPVKNIQVIMNYDTAFTDVNGIFTVNSQDFPQDIKYDVNINDVDGSENGSFTNKKISVQFYESKLTGGDGNWYEGSTTETVNIKIDPLAK